MSDKRVFCGSIRVKIDTKNYLFEFAHASLYGGDAGLFRVRVNRCWLPSFYSEAGLVKIIEKKLCNNQLSNKPDLRVKDAVSVRYEHDGIEFYNTTLLADPILNYEGIWVCPVFIFGFGVVYINCEQIEFLRRRL